MRQHRHAIDTAMSTTIQFRPFLNEDRENLEHWELEIFVNRCAILWEKVAVRMKISTTSDR